MKKKESGKKLFDLIHENLSGGEENKINEDIRESGITRDDLESIRSLDSLMENMIPPEPTERMDRRFYAMLEEEKKKELLGEPVIKVRVPFYKLFMTSGIRVAAGIGLFLLGWFASGWFSSTPVSNDQVAGLAGEVKQLKETLILTMMEQSSPVARIKAVNMVSEFKSADNQIITGLLKVLNQDENDNLRLLSLDALSRYLNLPEVRQCLISSIGNQTSPLVQLRLAEIMLALNEKRAVPEFQKVLKNANLNYSVRGKINEAVVVLL
jgi:hypothetical protein